MHKITFTIPTTLPTLNEIIDTAKFKKGKYGAYRRMKSEYDFVVRTACPHTDFMLEYIRHINVLWISKDKRTDKDNIRAGMKFILDGIQGKLLTKDGYNNIGAFSDSFELDKSNPRVVVTIYFNEEDKVCAKKNPKKKQKK